ncbi:MAG: hypothetical protein ABIV63_17115 [Caldimonas sp.]
MTGTVLGAEANADADADARPLAEGWLSLAAAPTFAAMALAISVQDAAAPALLCSSVPHPAPWTGMVAMYALMSAFHWAPWGRLMARRRRPAGPRLRGAPT